MALKITTKDGVVIEGDNAQEVISALKIMQGQRVAPIEYRATPEEMKQLESAAERNPRGYNRKLALQALASAGMVGSTQSQVQQWIAKIKNVDLAVSSVRHALIQLQGQGWAIRTDDTWRISSHGVQELGRLEDTARKAKTDLEDLVR